MFLVLAFFPAQISAIGFGAASIQAPPSRAVSESPDAHSPLVPNFAQEPAMRPENIGKLVAPTSPRPRGEEAVVPLNELEDVENAISEGDLPVPIEKRLTPEETASYATSDENLALDEIILLGLIGRRHDARALIRTPEGEVLTLKTGDNVNGWELRAIDDRSVILKNDDTETRLFLPSS